MKKLIPGGLLVAVEGIDGAGKTTISALLAQWCGERGIACTISKEPTGLKWGQELRRSASEGRLTLVDELMLFAKDREDHVSRSIAPALNEDHVVILDRYYWSTAAYQGARGADVDHIINQNEVFAPVPDIYLVLDVDAETGLKRIRGRGDEPNEFENVGALTTSRDIFVTLAKRHCKRAALVNANLSLRPVYQTALSHFQQAAVEKIARSGLGLNQLNSVLEFFGGDPIES